MIGAVFVALFQAAAGQPAAAPPAQTAPAAQATPETERDARLREIQERQKLVCRDERTIGSRIPTRRCRSAADVEAEKNDSRQWIDRAQTRMPTKEY